MSTLSTTTVSSTMASPSRAVLRPTRLLLGAFAVLTAIATNQLYILATRTEDYFSWTVLPPLTAAVMGAGYAAGCLMVILGLRSREWAYVRVSVVTVLVFTVLTLAATLVHLDRFHFGADGVVAGLAAWFWLTVYVVAPILMLVVIVLQARVPGTDPPATRPFPRGLAVASAAQLLVLGVVGVVMFLAPETAARVWPWTITPLTSRVLAAWLLAFAVGLALTLLRRDLAYARLTALPYAIFGVLTLLALARFSSDVEWDRPAAWTLVAALLAMIGTGVAGALALRMRPGASLERQRP